MGRRCSPTHGPLRQIRGEPKSTPLRQRIRIEPHVYLNSRLGLLRAPCGQQDPLASGLKDASQAEKRAHGAIERGPVCDNMNDDLSGAMSSSR